MWVAEQCSYFVFMFMFMFTHMHMQEENMDRDEDPCLYFIAFKTMFDGCC